MRMNKVRVDLDGPHNGAHCKEHQNPLPSCLFCYLSYKSVNFLHLLKNILRVELQYILGGKRCKFEYHRLLNTSFSNVMEIAVKNRTFSLVINAVMKRKLKGYGFGFHEVGIDCTQVFVSLLSEIGRLMLCIWVERETCL